MSRSQHPTEAYEATIAAFLDKFGGGGNLRRPETTAECLRSVLGSRSLEGQQRCLSDHHYARKVTIGSTSDARRAGRTQAVSAVAVRAAAVAAYHAGRGRSAPFRNAALLSVRSNGISGRSRAICCDCLWSTSTDRAIVLTMSETRTEDDVHTLPTCVSSLAVQRIQLLRRRVFARVSCCV